MPRPVIQFHGVARIEFEPVREFATSKPFATRRLILTDEDGERFEIPLFAADANALLVAGDDAPQRENLTAEDQAQAEEAANRG